MNAHPETLPTPPQEPVQEIEAKELYNGFTELGSNPEMTEIEFAFPAQAEAALRG